MPFDDDDKPTDHAIVSSVANDLPVGVWVARAPGGEFVYANKEFAEIMGVGPRPDVAVGQYAAPYGIHTPTGDLYPEHRMPFVRALEERTSVTVDDIVIHRPGGEKVNIRANARPMLGAEGEITHVVIAFLDITREVEAERARAQFEGSLYHAQKMDSIGTLAGGIAHDFNNLLAAAKVLVEMLRRSDTDPTRLSHLEQLERVTDSAAELTRALLGFARRGKNLAQRLSVNEVVRGVASLVGRTMDRRIEVSTRLSAATGAVIGDASQIEHAVMNLAVNARDAMPDGGRLELATYDQALVADDPARPKGLPVGSYVVIEVTDTGTGIDPSIRSRIFDPYFTTKPRTDEAGTGLGLAMVHGIADNHGGSVEIVDAEPRGTTARIWLPAAPATFVAASSAPPRRKTPHKGSGLLLLVDDEEFVRRAAKRALETMGYDVVAASDGVEAVQIFRERHTEIVAVLLDMIMPRLGGRATFLELRKIDPDVRVVLTTGYALNDEAQCILDLGVRAFVPKPFNMQTLADALAEAMSPASSATTDGQ